MTLSPTPVESFGGLNVDTDPGDLGWSGAIDLCDVELDRAGILRTRDLFSSLVANTSLTDPSVVGVGGPYWIASTTTAVRLYNNNSAVAAAAVAPCQYFNGSVQAFGTPTTSYIYLADVSKVNAIRRLTTAGVISAPAGMPSAALLSRTPNDNRLVAADIASNPHRVQFSNAGDAETWGANDYVDLDPGDNEEITGAAVHGNSLYVFKLTKIFEFYGTSTDSSGNPVFNYRTVTRGLGATGYVAPGPDGVYFLNYSSNRQSVYRINSGGITDIGRPISRVLSGLAPSTFTPGSFTTIDHVFANDRYRLLVANNGVNIYCFSYDPVTERWSLMKMPDSTAYIADQLFGKRMIVAGTGSNAAVHYLDPTNSTSDSLRTPSPYYRSGFSDVGTPDMKRIHSWRMQGSGDVTFKVSTDFGSLDSGTAVALGTAPAIADKPIRRSPRGRQFSWQIESTSTFSVNNLIANVAGKRKAGEHVAA